MHYIIIDIFILSLVLLVDDITFIKLLNCLLTCSIAVRMWCNGVPSLAGHVICIDENINKDTWGMSTYRPSHL